MDVKVWLGGEGPNELGDRDYPGGERPGVVEALLRRMRERGWVVDGATRWRDIRKYRVGAGISGHADGRNVLGLVFTAYEAGCEVVAFVRDRDADKEREEAIIAAIQQAVTFGWKIAIVGRVARPCLEGWIAALLGQRDTDEMSRERADRALESADIDAKATAAYVRIVEEAVLGASPGFGLPVGTESLRAWLDTANRLLNEAVSGT